MLVVLSLNLPSVLIVSAWLVAASIEDKTIFFILLITKNENAEKANKITKLIANT